MQRRRFGREFKVEAVRLIRERSVSVAQVAHDLDMHENVLRRWVRDLAADPAHVFPGHGQMKPEQLEIARLKREVAKLKAERDILKMGRSLLREGRDMRFAFVAKHRGIWPVAWLCEALGVSWSPPMRDSPGCSPNSVPGMREPSAPRDRRCFSTRRGFGRGRYERQARQSRCPQSARKYAGCTVSPPLELASTPSADRDPVLRQRA